MFTSLSAFASDATAPTWATQTETPTPQDVQDTESIEVDLKTTESSTILESDNRLPLIQTRIARSSMLGSAMVVLFGATYFESRRVKDGIEQAEMKARTIARKLEQLGRR